MGSGVVVVFDVIVVFAFSVTVVCDVGPGCVDSSAR